ncbi:hypothetical protein SAMN00017405_1453 [Desulfonispora thiosulfatigenes DSM 11270]|uniref:S1 motif domain-containing protein n=1 Tax=Desulfonispora thiosulfatigenes DSM 11270 TaxID=656914 RepID=A0A1W1VS22_DESTI|nr:S1-like domain-containing RNA-binding protein [Desulfonispora thiosulfatigenes]SMB96073.1 hypothetical protein SAMN00017405_1453 [Desulfonispora thiosulfatigenes DSM 11270]
MQELGKKHTLIITRVSKEGIYLKSQFSDIEVLLPKKEEMANVSIGDVISVFVYKDMDNTIKATLKEPKINLGEIASLKVVDVTEIGAFLDWGLDKDLLLPNKKQTYDITKGQDCLVSLYLNENDKLCATMRISDLLSSDSPYKVNDKVKGTIYDINEDMGAFLAIDNKYHGLILKNELYNTYNYGDKIEARVIKVRDDGKLDLSVREKAYLQMDTDTQIIMDAIEQGGGKLDLNDSSDPVIIKEKLMMSKKAFKRALGRLMKEDKIKQINEGIEKI